MAERFEEFYKKGEVVGSYDRVRLRGLKEGVNREIELEVIDALAPKGKILEVGSGTGFITQILEKKGSVTAIDVSQEMISAAKKRAKKAKFIHKGLFDFNPKGKFDFIVTIRVLGHFSPADFSKALKKMHSLIKDDGKIIFNVENKSIIRRLIRAFRERRVETYQFSISDLQVLLSESSLKIEKIIPTDHFWLLFPFYIINKILFGKLRSFILRLERALLHFPCANVNWIVRCRKS